jgi:mono/diheme cytochrome c family protein
MRHAGCMQAAMAALAATLVVALPLVGTAQAEEPAVETDDYAITRGGQLYDKWWEALEKKPPSGNHPSYPANAQQKGDTTWRCKECHGWDYRGADGAYAKGGRATGIKGIRAKAGADPKQIATILRDKTHAYTPEMLPDKAIERLSRFVSAGQIDASPYIDIATKKANGDAARGAGLYQTVCAVCHGFDGKTLNFGSKDKPEFVGTIAQDNPWEMLHKIRNGQPSAAMPAWLGLAAKDQIDVLTYVQTLPAK